MEIKFRQQYLEDLYEGKKSKEKRFKSNQSLVNQYVKTVKKLEGITVFEQIYQLKSLNFEALSGNLQGLFSVRINDQYRLIFDIVRNTEPPFEVQLLELEEISKHYE
ncbi:type II toxin-antitoxin system RelE/ParE family toxin [Pontibacter sp. FD36]|uniref:type II toxin-antitoxin system RelE/ParE family toxin n=1 Tax=Pontibacter sp. FD36 TaxID=2789860 RepID=UPI0018AA5675|nr:type II toxin-antitoxin system RelE/ParE family toxin [Pontibacter sp. FD36]MBF8964057.1 type II toxin-antitoxin system RelE/ParE family toxin [Pontibacter sp. FD36]